MSEYKSVKHHWNRPPLPEDNTGSGLRIGWVMIVIGLAIIYGASQLLYGWTGLAIVGLGAVSLGVVTLTICSILREVRRMAFEAALRAGEVKIEERKPKHRSVH